MGRALLPLEALTGESVLLYLQFSIIPSNPWLVVTWLQCSRPASSTLSLLHFTSRSLLCVSNIPLLLLYKDTPDCIEDLPVVQGFPGGSVVKNHLAMQCKHWFLVLEDPTCHGAVKPMCHNYGAHFLELASQNYWAYAFPLLKPTHPELMLCNTCLPQLEKATCNNEDPPRPKYKINASLKNKKNFPRKLPILRPNLIRFAVIFCCCCYLR